jgi:uncharacterized membrane protein (DUF485 family)
VTAEDTARVEREQSLRALAKSRWRVAITLTAAMVAVYFGFIALIAFRKPLLGRQLIPGLSIGILLGVLVIVSTWVLTWAYVRWANDKYDPELDRLTR